MGRPSYFNPSAKHWFLPGLLLLIIVFAAHIILLPASAAQLGYRVLQLQDNEVGITTEYQLVFDLATAGTIGSVDVQFCSNDPFPATACTAPAGLDVSGASLVDQGGPGDFSVDSANSTANDLILTRIASAVPLGTLRFDLSGIVNPSSPGSYYARVQTFPTTDTSGPASDYGGIAFAITNQLSISAEVPPYLIFCTGITISGLNCANASGDFIDFGELSTTHASSSSSQMLVATNAEGGYNVTINGTTMTSGTHVINALAVNDVSRPGTSQFGLNLRANSTPANGNDPSGTGVAAPQPNYDQPNSYRFVTDDTLINNPAPDDVRLFTASYLVNVPVGQAPGIYVSTLTYICLADF